MRFRSWCLSWAVVVIIQGGCSSHVDLPASEPGSPPVKVIAVLTVRSAEVSLLSVPERDGVVVERVRTGDRLLLIERQPEWLLVASPSMVQGWVQPSSLVPSICTENRSEPLIIEQPPLRFRGRRVDETVVVEGEYTAEGKLIGTRVLSNSTGDPEIERLALEDLAALKFLPPTVECRPRRFFYTLSRQF